MRLSAKQAEVHWTMYETLLQNMQKLTSINMATDLTLNYLRAFWK